MKFDAVTRFFRRQATAVVAAVVGPPAAPRMVFEAALFDFIAHRRAAQTGPAHPRDGRARQAVRAWTDFGPVPLRAWLLALATAVDRGDFDAATDHAAEIARLVKGASDLARPWAEEMLAAGHALMREASTPLAAPEDEEFERAVRDIGAVFPGDSVIRRDRGQPRRRDFGRRDARDTYYAPRFSSEELTGHPSAPTGEREPSGDDYLTTSDIDARRHHGRSR